MVMRNTIATLVATATGLVSSAALACPVCASREEPSSLRWVALGAFIVSPWIVAGVIAFYIRKGALAERAMQLPSAGPLPTENME